MQHPKAAGNMSVATLSSYEPVLESVALAADSFTRTASTTFRPDGRMPSAAQPPASTAVCPSTNTLNWPYGPRTNSTSVFSSRRSRAVTRTACSPVSVRSLLLTRVVKSAHRSLGGRFMTNGSSGRCQRECKRGYLGRSFVA